MRKKKKSILVLAMISFFTVTTLFFLGLSEVGGVKPERPDPLMPILEEIHDIVLDTNYKVEGYLIQKTGQTESYATGDDGDLEKGVELTTPRFFDMEDGTVMDNLTGLIWLQNANCFGPKFWATALSDANGLASGSCGLTDGSVAGDWHLANFRELHSLIDYGNNDRALPSGHPFTGVQTDYHSSTTNEVIPDSAWAVGMVTGNVFSHSKDYNHYVWPVRGGY
jgi:hypothetical protein